MSGEHVHLEESEEEVGLATQVKEAASQQSTMSTTVDVTNVASERIPQKDML
jgi:hypothetical protein